MKWLTKSQWRKVGTFFLAYFSIMLVASQVMLNLLSFVFPKVYAASGFYLNTFYGVNVWFAIFLVIFTHKFSFCSVSKWCAWAELLFGAFYLYIRQDNIYNIMFQITVGTIALLWTIRLYVKKFPYCRISLVLRFLNYVRKEGSCRRGLDRYDYEDRKRIMQHRHEHQ